MKKAFFEWPFKIWFIITILFKSILNQNKMYSPQDLITELYNLSVMHSNIIKIDTAQSRYRIPKNKCPSDKPNIKINEKEEIDICDNIILIVTDFYPYNLNRPHIYVSGTLDGKNKIGPSIIIELIKYLIQKNPEPTWLTELLSTVVLVITPNTNAYGFANDKDTDLIQISSSSQLQYVNPSMDFYVQNAKTPNMNTNSQCLLTQTTKTISYLFREFNFVQSILLSVGARPGLTILKKNNLDDKLVKNLSMKLFIGLNGYNNSPTQNDLDGLINLVDYHPILSGMTNTGK
jgi:hypothetical protein